MAEPIWAPQEKQRIFLERPEYEVLYGGAAGGGKSEAAVMLPLQQVHIPHFKALILRKTYPQLSELIDKSKLYYARAFPRARYHETAHRWTFPSGATVDFGSMQHPADRENYRGKQFDVILFDELTHFSWEEYAFMFSRNRPSGPGTFVCIRATTNPGGVGHGWVKERFITAAPPMTPIVSEVEVTLPDGRRERHRRTRLFVPASVFDNPVLLRNDPDYTATLAMQPKALRDAMLYGSWDSYEGQVFTEWKDDPAHYADRQWTHVIDPFEIPGHWAIYCGFDWGYARPFSAGWYAADPDGRIYRIAEYYGCNGEPNTGLRMEPTQVAAEIRRFEREHPLLRGRAVTRLADPAIFERDGGESVAELMERPPNFLTFSRGDHTRLPGKMQLHYRLAFDGSGRPGLQVFKTCRHFIRTVPALVYDPSRAEDVDTAGEDHIYDECRYVLMANPMAPPRRIRRPADPFDPLNQREGEPAHTGIR